jgi:hypothetical protein
MMAGRLVSATISAGLTLAVCIKKSLGFGYYLLVILAAALAFFGGGSLLGLIPVAFLTTRPKAGDPSPEATFS